MRQTLEIKLQEAYRAFVNYQFHAACDLYRKAFSRLPFQTSPILLGHVGHFTRTLYELDRTDELRFYLPVLESHWENRAEPSVGYALGYLHAFIASKTRAKALFETVRQNSNADVDSRIKSVMMLAYLCDDNNQTIHYIQSITEPAEDPILGKLLQIWRCVVLRLSGRSADSVAELDRLIPTFASREDWYCLLSARNAKARAHVALSHFDQARETIRQIVAEPGVQRFRTVRMHEAELDKIYRAFLAKRTIEISQSGNAMYLSHGGHRTRLVQEKTKALTQLLVRHPSITAKRVSTALRVSAVQLETTLELFTQKLCDLYLPADSLVREANRIQLLPVLKLGGENIRGFK